eukprot:59124-Lingulodinium_polyedra.AAC.1
MVGALIDCEIDFDESIGEGSTGDMAEPGTPSTPVKAGPAALASSPSWSPRTVSSPEMGMKEMLETLSASDLQTMLAAKGLTVKEVAGLTMQNKPKATKNRKPCPICLKIFPQMPKNSPFCFTHKET